METAINQLADYILAQAASMESGQARFLVGVTGYPGSGKSSLAYPLTARINEKAGGYLEGEVAVCVGMDGWHYSQMQLEKMEDPENMFRRRGAHFTFDGHAFSQFVSSLKDTTCVTPRVFPSFSHNLKDPVADGGLVLPCHKIVILEGLYCSLNVPPWRDVAESLDERIWLDIPRQLAKERLVKRHLQDGVEATLEAACQRAEESDLLNGDFIVANMLPPTITVGQAAETQDGEPFRSTYARPDQSVASASVRT